MPTQEQVMQQRQQQEKQEEQRGELLQKILTPEALERIKRIELVKPEKVCPKNRLRQILITTSTNIMHLTPLVLTRISRTLCRPRAMLRRRASCRTWC